MKEKGNKGGKVGIRFKNIGWLIYMIGEYIPWEGELYEWVSKANQQLLDKLNDCR